MKKKEILLAYSGGLDTSVILKWLIEKGHNVTCYIANVGQKEDFDAAKEKALSIGATQVVIDDLREEFVSDFIAPFLKTGAVYEGKYLLGTALARPVIARGMVRVAKELGLTALSHGATGKGNDQVRFELAVYQLMPSASFIVPWRNEEFLAQFQGRSDLLDYAKKKQIPVESTQEKLFSMDANLMHISYEGGILEDPMTPPPEKMFQMTQSPEQAPEEGCDLLLHFQEGIPTDLEITGDKKVSGIGLILEELNVLAGKHGIGRIDIVESRIVGMKSRGVYETPGVTVLAAAHHDLELLTLDREVLLLKEEWKPKIARLIYGGLWFSPEFKVVMAAIHETQKQVTGVVQLRLYKGNVIVRGRSSSCGMYSSSLASMDCHGGYDPQDATGFIHLNALRMVRAHGGMKIT